MSVVQNKPSWNVSEKDGMSEIFAYGSKELYVR